MPNMVLYMENRQLTVSQLQTGYAKTWFPTTCLIATPSAACCHSPELSLCCNTS